MKTSVCTVLTFIVNLVFSSLGSTIHICYFENIILSFEGTFTFCLYKNVWIKVLNRSINVHRLKIMYTVWLLFSHRMKWVFTLVFAWTALLKRSETSFKNILTSVWFAWKQCFKKHEKSNQGMFTCSSVKYVCLHKYLWLKCEHKNQDVKNPIFPVSLYKHASEWNDLPLDQLSVVHEWKLR